MTSDPLLVTVDPTRARRVRCPSCTGEKTVNNRNSEGHWYCRCLSCGCRFWHSEAPDI